MKLSKNGIIGIVVGAVVLLGLIIAVMPKGLHATYTNTSEFWGAKEIDTIVFDGKNYHETVTRKTPRLFDDKKIDTDTDKYSGTFKVTDNEVTFSGKTANGATAKLSKDKNVLTTRDGQQLTKKE